MHLKYIKLLILKILFVLGLFNLKFSFKIPGTAPPPLLPHQKKYSSHNNTSPPHQNKNCWPFPTTSKYFSNIFNPPPQTGRGGTCHDGSLYGFHVQFALYLLTYTLFNSYHIHALPLWNMYCSHIFSCLKWSLDNLWNGSLPDLYS